MKEEEQSTLETIHAAYKSATIYHPCASVEKLVEQGLVEPCELRGRIPSFRLTDAGLKLIDPDVRGKWVTGETVGSRQFVI